MATDQAHSDMHVLASGAARLRDASRGMLGDLDLRWLVPISLLAVFLIRYIRLA